MQLRTGPGLEGLQIITAGGVDAVSSQASDQGALELVPLLDCIGDGELDATCTGASKLRRLRRVASHV